MTDDSVRIEFDVPTYFLNNGREVLAHDKGPAKGRPKTFANRTQAQRAAKDVGGVVLCFGRPFYVGWDTATPASEPADRASPRSLEN